MNLVPKHNSVWVIEAKNSSQKEYEPLCGIILGYSPTFRTRDEARRTAKHIFNANQYNQAYRQGLAPVPACQYRVRKYSTGGFYFDDRVVY